MTERRGLTQLTNFPRTFGQIRGIPAADGVVPAFENVSLLVPFDDADPWGSTIDDASSNNHTCTVQGAAASQASGQFDKAGDFGSVHNVLASINCGSDASFQFGTGDFCVEAWVQWDVKPSLGGGSPNVIASKQILGAGNRGWALWVNNDDKLYWSYSTDGTAQIDVISTVALTIVVGIWYHITATRLNNVITIFQDGVIKKQSDEGLKDYATNAHPLLIGESGFASFERAFTGNIDDLRVTKGEAVYEEAFTPPIAAHPTS